jgi:hypothetical protein
MLASIPMKGNAVLAHWDYRDRSGVSDCRISGNAFPLTSAPDCTSCRKEVANVVEIARVVMA